MIRYVTALFMFCSSLALPAQAASWGDWLAAQEGRRRLLVVAALAEDARRDQQVNSIQRAAAGMRDREVTLIEVLPDRPKNVRVRVDGKPYPGLDATEAKETFHLPPDGFAVILIGKDGQEAARYEAPVPTEEIFARIDAMPMRQREMAR